jgi:hypothetical protein
MFASALNIFKQYCISYCQTECHAKSNGVQAFLLNCLNYDLCDLCHSNHINHSSDS